MGLLARAVGKAIRSELHALRAPNLPIRETAEMGPQARLGMDCRFLALADRVS